MVKINLLPIKEDIKRKIIILHGAVLVVCLAVVIVGLVIFQSITIHERNKLQANMQTTKDEILKLSVIATQIDTFKKDKLDLDKKLAIIKELEKKKYGPIQFLDEISLLIPEKAWVLSLTNTGDSLVLDGAAVDNETIADFLKRLQNSPLFTNVELVLSQQEGGSQKYVIKCKINLQS